MENLIIILSVLLNIALIIVVEVYMKRFNDAKKECKEKTNDCTLAVKEQERLKKDRDNLYEDIKKCNRNYDILKENTSIEINQQNESIKVYIAKCDRQNAEIESLQSINNTLLNDNRKLSDEITILKEQVESLTNHLQEQLEKHEGAKPEKKRNKKETEKESARNC